MSVSSQISSTPNFNDPSTYLQRPTSAKIPDVSHLLNNIFGEKYTKDKLTADVVKNLTVSADVDNDYHKRYVQKLKEAQLIKESRIQEYAMLEKHILEAQAKALAYEDREEDKRKKTCQEPDRFGVPPTKSYFSYCLDDTLLKNHDLLVPSDYYYKPKRPFVPMPKNEGFQSFQAETVSSKERSKQKMVLPPINSSKKLDIDDIGDILRSESTLSDYHMNSPSEEQSHVKLRKEKPFWKDVLKQEDRINDREYLKNLENKVKFLTNPRLEAIRTAQISNESPVVFEILPKKIEFNKYIIGKVYECSLEVRNTSKIAHQFRAIPPKTQYFSLSLGQYPQNQSLIAPGLSVVFNIRFSPDSLSAFEDEISVECSNGSRLIVPVIAKRESPCLTIGSILNCGHSLVGQIKGCRFIIQNTGGDGRFVVFPKSTWPASTFKTNVLSTTLNVYPFEIQPSIFELRKDDIFVLEVVFKPPDLKKYEQEIVIACDNCATISFKLIGEGKLAEIEFLETPETSNSTLNNCIALDDFKDNLSSKILRFPSLNPKALTRKQFSIKNNSQCPIDFSWQMYKPVFQDNLEDQNQSKNVNYVLDSETVFNIIPRQGTLEREESKNFEVVFNPEKVGIFESVAHLILHCIPEINKQMILDSTNSLHKTFLTKEDISTSDFLSSVIELRGECEPFQFTLDPPAIFVPGPVFIQSTIRKAFRLINMSICPINFNWKQILEPHIIQVEPSYGEIAPKSYALMDVMITGLVPGKIVDDMACYVEFADEPIYLHIETEIKGPEIQIKEAGIDFGLVRIGDTSKSFITIENVSNLPLKWSLECLENKDLYSFPSNGSLLPLETKEIEITFNPKEEAIMKTIFVLNAENGNNLTFFCHSQAQKPKITFENDEIVLEELYLNVEKVFLVHLVNHSNLGANFFWKKAVGRDSTFCDITIEEVMGYINGRSIKQFFVKIKANIVKSIDDLSLPCYINDTNETIYLNIKSVVKDIKVDILLRDDNNYKHANLIDFGNVQIRKRSFKEIIFKNTSGIRTIVNLEVQSFPAFEIYEEENVFASPSKISLIDKFKIGDEIRGMGFGLEKNCFELPEFSTISISIISIPHFWGQYEDSLNVKIDGIDNKISIPIRINVLGNPIKLFTGKVYENEEISMIRFGSSIQGQNPMIRKIQIQNESIIPIDINWKVFIKKSDDNQLFDVNMTIDENNEPSINYRSETSNASYSLPYSSHSSSTALRDLIEPIKELRETGSEYSHSSLDDRKPLIKLNLTGHFGSIQESDKSVFFLDKNLLKLKPREKTTMMITFNTELDDFKDYEAIFVGYLGLSQNFIQGRNFKRKINYEKEPLIFKATGKLESPNLRIEYDNDDLNFVVSTGDLINSDLKLDNSKIFINQFSILNSSLASTEFKMDINSPFEFSNNSFLSKTIQLKTKSKIQCPINFVFNMDFITKLNFKNDSGPITYTDEIIINFAKEIQQKIPISAKIYIPHLEATTEFIDFETTMVGQERQAQFFIRNHSFSSTLWSIRIEDDADQVFRCDSLNGFIESIKANKNNCQKTISVFFKAKNKKSYSSRLVIELSPSVATKPIYIQLIGIGSYDQKLDAILDV
ncbi:unnamed protein product [Brachionus calyciflorus]|uniref:Uncharacterized protein n=1 Tax=Brachionus calyciflorus TaxID=104777 RepID=A0A813QYE6_9BILA|nr:unnamed protein product [Brachionus calyciflorus]